jgi:transcriptional regulator with XRE-family HTH domain
MLEGLKTVGGRMAILRAMGNLSQKDLSKLCDINLSTIENIECGRTSLKKEQAEQIVQSLKNVGISTSSDWIIKGTPLISPPLDFANNNVFHNVCSMMNSTVTLVINEHNDFIKAGSVVLASAADIVKIIDEPFMVVTHSENVFACKVSKLNGKNFLHKEINGDSLEFNKEMSVYFPSIIIMKQ